MSVITNSIQDKDLYQLFGVLQDASVKEIKTAYRKKALECHPDKNPDNPKANELFHELQSALAILIDQSAREAYDKVLNAKLAAKKRNQALDSRRKKLKEDLEERERQAQQQSTYDIRADELKFQQELDRLRKLSSIQVEEELNYLKKLIKERKASSNDFYSDNNIFRIKVKWHTKSSSSKKTEEHDVYTADDLNKIFSKYGKVNCVVISVKKKGSALIEFDELKAASNAFSLEKGYVEYPLDISWVGNPPTGLSPYKETHAYCNIQNQLFSETKLPHQSIVDESDEFEAAVLRSMKEAELKKKTNS